MAESVAGSWTSLQKETGQPDSVGFRGSASFYLGLVVVPPLAESGHSGKRRILVPLSTPPSASGRGLNANANANNAPNCDNAHAPHGNIAL